MIPLRPNAHTPSCKQQPGKLELFLCSYALQRCQKAPGAQAAPAAAPLSR